MSTFGIPLDCIVCSHTNPLWKRSILTLFLGQCTLCTECLLRRLQTTNTQKKTRTKHGRQCCEGFKQKNTTNKCIILFEIALSVQADTTNSVFCLRDRSSLSYHVDTHLNRLGFPSLPLHQMNRL